jgi:hypothetical protein
MAYWVLLACGFVEIVHILFRLLLFWYFLFPRVKKIDIPIWTLLMLPSYAFARGFFIYGLPGFTCLCLSRGCSCTLYACFFSGISYSPGYENRLTHLNSSYASFLYISLVFLHKWLTRFYLLGLSRGCSCTLYACFFLVFLIPQG